MKFRSTTKKHFKKLFSAYRAAIANNNQFMIGHLERIFKNDFGVKFESGEYAFHQSSKYSVQWGWIFNKDGYKGYKFNRLMQLKGVNF